MIGLYGNDSLIFNKKIYPQGVVLSRTLFNIALSQIISPPIGVSYAGDCIIFTSFIDREERAANSTSI